MTIIIENPKVLDSGFEKDGTAFVTICGVDIAKTITLLDKHSLTPGSKDDISFLQEINGATSIPDWNDACSFFCGLDRATLRAHPQSSISDGDVEKAKTILNIATEKVCESRKFKFEYCNNF